MDEATRKLIERATQKARSRLEQEFSRQLEGDYNILPDGSVLSEPGANLNARERLLREKLVAAIEHRRALGMTAQEARDALLREAAFTTLNRFVALKMLEARKFIQPCISQGEQSSGFKEFGLPAEGLIALPDKGYRLYLESLFDEIGREVRVLFDRRDVAGQLWPNRQTLTDLLGILNDPVLSKVWSTPETIGWVYQYFNRQDERREMRKAQAPRNSYELAVRNQFFTPDYVVAFLADNTLGRIWYEMRTGNTQLADDCRYMVRRPNEPIPERTKKDPRDLRVIDPAVGSGHYLLYCFELLLTTYTEAWADPFSPASEHTGKTLQEDYASRDELCRATPGLILRYNLYGIDIDPRAAQIAELALWMRAQQTYDAIAVRGADRPPIDKTNIVVAEPMPGDKTLLAEFLRGLDERLRPLVEAIWEQMRLAGEAGSLLRIEKAIEQELRDARSRQLIERRPSHVDLFGDRPEVVQEVLIADEDGAAFWDRAEGELLAALEAYAHAASGAAGARRRLFADNAAQGFAFVDLCRKRYDVVLMNPPFGTASTGWKAQFIKAYPRTKNDLYAAFVERGLELLHDNGMLGAITSRTGFFLTTFQKWRTMLLHEARPIALADLGGGVLEAMVETAAYCLQLSGTGETTFFRLLGAQDKKASLSDVVSRVRQGMTLPTVFRVNPASFDQIPGRPFAYWVSEQFRKLFSDLDQFSQGGRAIKVGLQTGSDYRFVRTWWEAPANRIAFGNDSTPVEHFIAQSFNARSWFPFAKGGRYSTYYSDIHLVVNWENNGKEIKNLYDDGGSLLSRPQNSDYYFMQGVTWSDRTSRMFSARAWPRGGIFSVKGSAGFFKGDELWILGLMNGLVFNSFLALMVGAGDDAARSYQVGTIGKVPFPRLSDTKLALQLRQKVATTNDLKRELDTCNELSHIFFFPALLQVSGETLVARAVAWAVGIAEAEVQLASYQREIDDLTFKLYGIEGEDRKTIEETLRSASKKAPSVNGSGDETDSVAEEDEGNDPESDEADDSDEAQPLVDSTNLIADLLSYAIGTAFGRWDVRCTTGERERPELPNPFDPLPVYSPGMLTEHPRGYPLEIRDILVDDEGHPDDIIARIRAVLKVIWSDQEDDIYQESVTVLVGSGHDLRPWLQKNFFEQHIDRYSKSRRKAPIYWCLSTPSRSYAVWFYYHRSGKDTLYKVLEDYVDPKIDYEQRKLNKLTADAPNPTASQRKAIEDQERLVAELRTFREEIARVAPLWDPDLNDGVIINYALLWRLTPWPHEWYDECRTTWEKLRRGDYDWSHLAMRLWPERVVAKCRDDRSLAIAHGLDDILWETIEGERSRPQEVSESLLQQLIFDRTSSAIVAALQALDDAPVEPEKPKKRAAATVELGGKRRGRKPRSDVVQAGMDLGDT